LQYDFDSYEELIESLKIRTKKKSRGFSKSIKCAENTWSDIKVREFATVYLPWQHGT